MAARASRAAWPGYDYLMQAEAGYLSLTGEPNGPPARFGLSIVDYDDRPDRGVGAAGRHAGRAQTGQGRDRRCQPVRHRACKISIYLATWFLNGGHAQGREPRSAHPSLTPSQLYRTADGWIFLMCNKQKFWEIFADLVGHAEWTQDPEFKDFAARLQNRERLNETIDQALATGTTDEWMARLGGKVPVAPVHDVASALDAPFAQERERIVEFDHPEHGPIRGIASAVRVAGAELPTKAAPGLGQDTESVLRAAGFDEDRIRLLREQRVVA